MTTNKKKAIIQYAYNPQGCSMIPCVNCPISYDRNLCHEYWTQTKSACAQYINDHPEEFTPEDIAEVLL